MRDAITRRFWEYNGMCRRELWPKYDAHQHWAKIEMPEDEEERRAVQVGCRPNTGLVGGAGLRAGFVQAL